MKKILKYLLFVLTFCVVFFISFKINIHRLEFAPMKLMETEWDDSVGTVYVDLDYENENGNTYNLYVPANLDKEKEQYLILYIHGGSFNSGAKGDGDIWCRYYASKGYLTASVDYTLQNQGKEASLFLMNEEIENAVKAIGIPGHRHGSQWSVCGRNTGDESGLWWQFCHTGQICI